MVLFYNNFNLIVSDDLCEQAKKRLQEIENKCSTTQLYDLNKMKLSCVKDVPKEYFEKHGDFGSIDDVFYKDEYELNDFFDQIEANLF